MTTPKVDFCQFQEHEARNEAFLAKLHIQRRDTVVGMVVACHLGGLLRAWVGVAGFVGTMAQSEMGGISGFLLYFRVFIALTHEWTDFVRLLVAVRNS